MKSLAASIALKEEFKERRKDGVRLAEHQGRCVLLTHAFDVAHEGDLISCRLRRKAMKEVLRGSDNDRPRASTADQAGARIWERSSAVCSPNNLAAWSMEQRAFTSAKSNE
jgi:hypothetical protein